ncbi:MAG TPA: S41 family peptidase [Steroidobacteraceae bacterium]|nr:S41 family peptidase [Steroidobacteraceae bacterium]
MFEVARSRPARTARWLVPLAALAALYGCGGGGGSGSTLGSGGGGGSAGLGGGGTGTGGSAPTTWTPGVFQPSSKFAALCASPRSGTDPYTQQPYPDVQGSAVDENNWLRSWTHELYLWYDEVKDADPSLYSTSDYFQLMKTTQTTSSGAPKDRFHFTYPTSVWESLSEAGVQVGYGVQWDIVQGTPPRSVRIAYLETAANLPADTVAANLVRGDTILAVDGADVVNATDTASINTINAGLSPSTAGETHTFTVQDPGSSTPRTVTLQAANVTSTPVLLEKTVTGADGSTVGYILYNEQVATAESELINAINDLKSRGVTDLVLDLRYDGGGLLDLASELGYMIGGNQTAGQTFEQEQFNNQYTTTNPVTGQPITPTLFHDTTQGFSTTAGQALPTLNLIRVAVITGQGTCSASESIINGLQGVGVTVYQIGSTTCGKPYGFYPQDNCGTTYFSIEFQGVNAKGFGGYGDGFSPANTTPSVGVTVPGCSVADDFGHALGDPSEGRLAAALAYLANPQASTCPSPPTGNAAPRSLTQRQLLERIFVRSPLQQMRILRR